MEEIFRNSICFVLYFTNCWRNQWKTLHASYLVGQCKGFVVPSHFPQFYPLHLPPKGDPNSEMVFQHQLAEFCSVGLQITGILPLSTEMCPWYLMSFSSMTVSHTHSFFHPQTSWFSNSQVYSWPVMLSFFFFFFLSWGMFWEKTAKCHTGSHALCASHELNKGVERAVALFHPPQWVLGARSELQKHLLCLRKAGLGPQGGWSRDCTLKWEGVQANYLEFPLPGVNTLLPAL